MSVKELRDALAQCPGEMPVVLVNPGQDFYEAEISEVRTDDHHQVCIFTDGGPMED